MQGLTKRREFLAAASGHRTVRPGFVLQTKRRLDNGPARFGFTVTKKTARKAVQRNRIRRRLKEAVRLLPHDRAANGYDFVLIGRRKVLTGEFLQLRRSVQDAVAASLTASTKEMGQNGK